MSEKAINGYQIRTDLLHLAKKIVEEQAFAQARLFEAKISLVKTPEELATITPPNYTIDDVLSTADKLYQFVQTK
jgi:hypothetical protein